MSGLFARSSTAGLDEVREAGGWIKGARFVRVTGFGLTCFGISSRGSSSALHLASAGGCQSDYIDGRAPRLERRHQSFP